jgi:hypothetical protein
MQVSAAKRTTRYRYGTLFFMRLVATVVRKLGNRHVVTATLLQLPSGLLQDICSYLSVQELRHIRSSCRRLALVGTEMLLPEVEIFYTMASLKRLEEISLHPVLRLHVRSLVYTTDRLPIYPDDYSTRWKDELESQEYSRRVARAMEIVGPESVEKYLAGLPQPHWSKTEVWKRWEAYREMRDEQ